MLIFIFVLFGGFSYGFVLRASLWFCLECFPLGMANGHALKSPMHIAAHIRSYMHEYICIIRIILHFPHPHGHPYSPHFVWRASLQLVHHSIREVVTQRILEVINFWHFDWPIHHGLWCSYDHHHRTYYKSASIILLDWIDREWHWGFQFQRNLLLVVTKIFLVVVDHH